MVVKKLIDLDVYGLEVLCFMICAIYGFNFLIGRNFNRVLARAWTRQVKQVIADNFSRVGVWEVKGPNDVYYE